MGYSAQPMMQVRSGAILLRDHARGRRGCVCETAACSGSRKLQGRGLLSTRACKMTEPAQQRR